MVELGLGCHGTHSRLFFGLVVCYTGALGDNEPSGKYGYFINCRENTSLDRYRHGMVERIQIQRGAQVYQCKKRWH